MMPDMVGTNPAQDRPDVFIRPGDSMKYLAPLTALLLAGCPVGPTPATCDALAEEGVSLEVGGGLENFTLLEPGALMEQGWGPQGGDHVWVSLRTTGLFGGSEWREDPFACPPGMIGGGNCGPRASEDSPRVWIDLTHDETLVARLGGESGAQFRMEGGEALGLTAMLQDEYSTYNWEGVRDVPADVVERAMLVDEAELLLSVTVEDACGSSITTEETVRINVEWLEDEPDGR